MKEEKINCTTEKKPKKKGSVIFTLFITGFFVLVAFFSVTTAVMPDKAYSENENRVLQQFPQFTWQGFADGSFMKNLESYLTDQFALRDTAITVKSFCERLLGKTRENGAYIGKNGFLFDAQAELDGERTKALVKSINAFAEKNNGLNTVFALVPNSSFVYAENLPHNLVLENQQQQTELIYSALSKNITTVDAVSALLDEKENSQVFYKTDHHWTTRGAFSVFKALEEPFKITVNEDDFEFHTVSDSFEGTLKSKVNSSFSADSVEVCFPKNSEGTYFIDFYGEREKTAGFFFQERLSSKNHYEVFLGGNYGEVSVKTTLEGDRKLIVIKDSFANCLIPMLTPYFSRILILDPRYMTESIDTVMQEDRFTDVLFLYNLNTFLEDTSLKTVL